MRTSSNGWEKEAVSRSIALNLLKAHASTHQGVHQSPVQNGPWMFIYLDYPNFRLMTEQYTAVKEYERVTAQGQWTPLLPYSYVLDDAIQTWNTVWKHEWEEAAYLAYIPVHLVNWTTGEVLPICEL